MPPHHLPCHIIIFSNRKTLIPNPSRQLSCRRRSATNLQRTVTTVTRSLHASLQGTIIIQIGAQVVTFIAPLTATPPSTRVNLRRELLWPPQPAQLNTPRFTLLTISTTPPRSRHHHHGFASRPSSSSPFSEPNRATARNPTIDASPPSSIARLSRVTSSMPPPPNRSPFSPDNHHQPLPPFIFSTCETQSHHLALPVMRALFPDRDSLFFVAPAIERSVHVSDRQHAYPMAAIIAHPRCHLQPQTCK
ncbi:hypothetical protein LR48_Vigan03g099800 [Vigna angularis]|uniref:Uncharacterized protein n=1 Tax=Phaseolus angularis TaxID=3914 RepID=A0A0L9U4B4_PHAAN|nr:hypothetical protein LR48_Vigan03g099800 [Vigna angularis]